MEASTQQQQREQQATKIQSLFRGRLARRTDEARRVQQAQERRAEAAVKEADAPPSPFLPTPHAVVSELLRLANVGPSSVVLDLGCGDGRVCVAAATERGARSIGLESDSELLQRARRAREEAGVSEEQVQLLHGSFDPPSAECVQALERANVVFLFLLPSAMGRVLELILHSVRAKVQQTTAENASSSSSSAAFAPPAAAAALPSDAHPPIPLPSACACVASVRTRVVCWTFRLPSHSPLLRGALEPTASVTLQSEHTRLHIYDLCPCMLSPPLQQGERNALATLEQRQPQQEPHTQLLTRYFFGAPAGSPAAPPSSSFDLSRLQWGHALNTRESLLKRLKQSRASGYLFIEADLRLSPAWNARAQSDPSLESQVASIQDVAFAHDAHESGCPFLDWFAALRQWSATHADVRLGLKLDFKQLEALESVLRYFNQLESGADQVTDPPSSSSSSTAASSLPPFCRYPLLWLNADVLAGPGCCPATTPVGAAPCAQPIDARRFLDCCARLRPDAVLSLGWTTRAPPESDSTAGDAAALQYTHEHVEAMLSLLRDNPSASQVTFPLRASLIPPSWRSGALQRLLQAPGHSLTVWTSVAEKRREGMQQTEEWIRQHLPRDRTFLDLDL